jgi:hypothetical protein
MYIVPIPRTTFCDLPNLKVRTKSHKNSLFNNQEMTDHDLSKWTILSLILTAATLIVGLIILVTK